jgi:hypothetical protein
MTADTCLLNSVNVDIPAVSFVVEGDVTQGSTVVANLSDLSGFIAATTLLKNRSFRVQGNGMPLIGGSLATYADGKITLATPANFFPFNLTALVPIETQRVALTISAPHLNSGILTGGLTDQVLALHGIGVIDNHPAPWKPIVYPGGKSLIDPAPGLSILDLIKSGILGVPTGIDPTIGLGQMPTWITLDLPDLTGEFVTAFAPQVSPLMLPKTIDLQAS